MSLFVMCIILKSIQRHYLLATILVVGLLLRIVGVTYGLPLWLVGDEPPFVLAALKMIELKTLLPVFHQEEFSTFFYFAPYLSYIYLIPFVGILGAKFLVFSGNTAEFIKFLLGNLSAFFTTARIMSALAGTATVWILYKTALNIFRNRIVALLSAGFLSLSTFHVLLSHWGRDWSWAVLFFTLALYTISQPQWTSKKRYIMTALVAGIAMGISVVAVFIPIFMALWIFFIDKKKFIKIIRNREVLFSIAVFLILFAISIMIFPGGFFFTKSNSLAVPKTFERLGNTYLSFIRPVIHGDPLLSVWALVGSLFILKFKDKNFTKKRTLLIIFLFINIYILSFFFTFYTGDRFAIYFYPLLALLAGYGMYAAWKCATKIKSVIIFIHMLSFAIMLLAAFQLNHVLLQNDTRAQARSWIEKNIPQGEKIVALAPLTRLSTTPDAIAEQESIDPSSLRKIDQTERELSKELLLRPRYHALNLYTLNNKNFYLNITSYVVQNNYRYALVSKEGFRKNQEKNIAQNILLSRGSIIATFSGNGIFEHDLTEGSVNMWSLLNMLFSPKGKVSNGPTIYLLDLFSNPELHNSSH